MMRWIFYRTTAFAKPCLSECYTILSFRTFCTGNSCLKNLTSMASTHFVFVYGTLKTGEPNHDVIASSPNGKYQLMARAETTKKWPLVIASRYNIPFLLYAEGKGSKVIGELYEVDDTVLERMDELECHPNYYVRQEETVCVLECANKAALETGKVLKAWIYFLKDFKPFMLKLPCLEEYSSSGPHGLKYVSRYNRTGDPYIMEVKNFA